MVAELSVGKDVLSASACHPSITEVKEHVPVAGGDMDPLFRALNGFFEVANRWDGEPKMSTHYA